MNKKVFITLSIGAVAVSTLGLLAAANYTNKRNYKVDGSSIATVTLDGTNNILDDSVITEGWEPSPKTKQLFSTSGGCVKGEFNFASSAVVGEYDFGGDNGFMTFTRNTSNGWRPTVEFMCDTGFATFELHASYDFLFELRLNDNTYISKADSNRKDIGINFTTSEFTGVKVTSILIFLDVVAAYSTTPDPLTISSVEMTYDVDACLANRK